MNYPEVSFTTTMQGHKFVNDSESEQARIRRTFDIQETAIAKVLIIRFLLFVERGFDMKCQVTDRPKARLESSQISL